MYMYNGKLPCIYHRYIKFNIKCHYSINISLQYKQLALKGQHHVTYIMDYIHYNDDSMIGTHTCIYIYIYISSKFHLNGLEGSKGWSNSTYL